MVIPTATARLQQQRANGIGKHRQKEARTGTVWCAFGIDSYFISRQRSAVFCKRSKQSKHTLLLSIDPYPYRKKPQ